MNPEVSVKINALLDLYNDLVSIRTPGDKDRWTAMAFIKHRTKELSCDPECPVPDLHLYDVSGLYAVRTLIESLGGSVMSPNQDWFSLRFSSRDYTMELSPDYGIQYTSYAKKAMADEMNHSNFYDEQTMAFYDSVSCGYSCTLFQNDEENSRIYLQTLEPWNCWFDCDIMGNYTSFFYRYRIDGYQLLERFGDSGNIPESVMDKARKGGKKAVFNMLFCIQKRNRIRDSQGRLVRFSRKINVNMKYASMHILLDEKVLLSESGYNEMPLVIHVWEKSGDSPYGIGLIMKFLPEFGKLNRLAFEYGLSVAKLNHGAWLVPDTMYNSFSDDPESRIAYQSSDLLPRPLQENIDVNAIGEQLALQQQYIQKLFYNDIFSYLLNQDKVFTATQVNAVKAEGMSKIYPIYTRMQSQKIDPSLKLVFSIMVENRRLRAPDRSLMGRVSTNEGNRLEFILDSAMSQMLQRYQSQTANSVIMDLAVNLINLGRNDLVEDYINLGNVILSTMEQTGADSNLYVSAQKRQAQQQERREMQQQALEQQQRLSESEVQRNLAGASNLNNSIGANGGYQ